MNTDKQLIYNIVSDTINRMTTESITMDPKSLNISGTTIQYLDKLCENLEKQSLNRNQQCSILNKILYSMGLDKTQTQQILVQISRYRDQFKF